MSCKKLNSNKYDSMSISEDVSISEILEVNNITTIYLPIDGTRRYFIKQTGIDYNDPNFFREYFNFSIEKLISLLEILFNLGFKYVIVLLMDKSAFNRDRNYLNNAIRAGIEPIYLDNRFRALYDKYNINLLFAGFNNLYQEFGFGHVTKKMQTINQDAEKIADHNLIFYTGPTDELDLVRISHECRKSDKDNFSDILTKTYHKLYPIEIPKIDISIFYGYPRDKVTPVLLRGKSVNYYIPNPSLSITKIQLEKAIHLTLNTKDTIKDSYQKYSNDDIISQFKSREDILLGEEWYSHF